MTMTTSRVGYEYTTCLPNAAAPLPLSVTDVPGFYPGVANELMHQQHPSQRLRRQQQQQQQMLPYAPPLDVSLPGSVAGGYGAAAVPRRIVQLQEHQLLAPPLLPHQQNPPPPRRGGGKRSYAEAITPQSAAENAAAQELTYRTLLGRIPVHPTQRSLMAALLRDELREILQINMLSYHKPGPENKVRAFSNDRTNGAACVLLCRVSRVAPLLTPANGW
jgi:hypothetical protein